jgi:hypothetical protein
MTMYNSGKPGVLLNSDTKKTFICCSKSAWMKARLLLVLAVCSVNLQGWTGVWNQSWNLHQAWKKDLSMLRAKANKSRLNHNPPRTRLNSSAFFLSIDNRNNHECPQVSSNITASLILQAWDLNVNDEDDWQDELREVSGIDQRKKGV